MYRHIKGRGGDKEEITSEQPNVCIVKRKKILGMFVTQASPYRMRREVKGIWKGIFQPNLLGDIMTC